MMTTTAHPTASQRRRRLRQARAFFLIALIVSALSLAQHCLPGEASAATPAAAEAPAR